MAAARVPVLNLTAILLAGAALSACTTMHPTLSNRLPGGPGAQANGAGAPGGLPSGKGGVYKVGNPYQVGGIWYVPKEDPNYDQTGVASWYGDEFHQKQTANGEIFDMHAVSAAHTTLPMPSLVEVTNLENGRKLVVRVNDRGPFVGNRVIDLSHEAARQLGYDQKGLANVRVRYLGPAPLGVGDGMRVAANSPPPAASMSPVTPVPAPSAVAARPLAPPAAVASQSLPPAAPAPYAQSQYAQNRYPPASSSYGSTPVTYAPTAMPGYSAPARPVYAPQPVRPVAAAGSAAPSANGLYRVQAGAYSNPDAAQRVASQLASAGQASVESAAREDGTTLYRVMLQASNDEGEAWALRDRVASLGYADARVIRPF